MPRRAMIYDDCTLMVADDLTTSRLELKARKR
jgi:hypothetical protein